MMQDQAQRDRAVGLRIGGFVTGYPGSPLGGMEGVLAQAREHLESSGVRLQPAQNEELAATSLIGTQMLEEHAHPDYDGVVGYWYGKGPGVDRSGDALKHGNFAGTSTHGAVVVLSGEDHEAKSSTVPYAQEFAFEHFGMPVLYPATVSEFISFGQHAVGLSRYSGCWVALKLAGSLCDGGETVNLDEVQPSVVLPNLMIDGRAFRKNTNFRFFPVVNVATERQLYYERHAAARAYARANGLDRIVVRTPNDRIGIIAAGKAYSDVRQALLDLGWPDVRLQDAGIRVLKMGMLCPMDDEIVKQFAEGLEHIIVVEEKRDFLERQIGRIVCSVRSRPSLVGKFDHKGRALFPIEGGLDQDKVAEALGPLLEEHCGRQPSVEKRLQEIAAIKARKSANNTKRTPTYCSGCPHNVGTKLAPGQIAWGAPGRHVFAAIMPEPTRRIEAVTQYGGEGLPWIGLSPFSARRHIVQNVGDGSLFHSSYLNIRYAIAANANITFKILYNGAIANTGGQPPVGQRSIPQLAHLLAIEGVKRIALIAKDPASYRGQDLPRQVEIFSAEQIETVQLALEKVEGVTVLIYDGDCANERRRQQKRGKVPKPREFTVINEDTCENCGNCGEVSSCMSLRKIATEFGEKTFVHQSSCNQDMSCIAGECPSFVTVRTEAASCLRRKEIPVLAGLPEKARPKLEKPFHVCLPGVGGTGVITVNAILAQAASMDGLAVTTFDQTGAAQKWGPVLSSLILTASPGQSAVNSVGIGCADLYLALDLLAAADATNLQRCAPSRSLAVINSSVLPTGEMIRNVRLKATSESMLASIMDVVDRNRAVVLDAGRIAEDLFGDYMMTNMIMVGAAYEAGLLPLSAASIEQAIGLNRVSVESNIQAFRAGRLVVANPAQLRELTQRPTPSFSDRVEEQGLQPAKHGAGLDRLMESMGSLGPELSPLLRVRVDDLISYQGAAYARKYLAVIARVLVAEGRAATKTSSPFALTRSVVVNLHKIMAYKDEYEVARLLTQSIFKRRVAAAFEGKIRLFFNLQPPLLRHLGMKRKIKVGEWFVPALRASEALKFVRGTPFDVFGYATVRVAERRLIGWYIEIIDEVCRSLKPETATVALALADLPEDIRGYEQIKLASIERVKAQAQQLLADLRQPKAMALSA